MINLAIFWVLGCAFSTIANIQGFNRTTSGVPFMILIASSWYGLYMKVRVWRNYSKLKLETPVSKSLADLTVALNVSAHMLDLEEARDER